MKVFWKIILGFIGLVCIAIIGILIAFKVSVKPGVFLIQRMFDQPITITDQAHYETAASQVRKLEDIAYTSRYDNNTFDIYYPDGVDEARPVLFWVHGGGYVGGDKEGVAEFSTYIAASNQIAVVAMNYEKAPSLQYPGQIKQLDEVYRYIHAHRKDFPMLDLQSVLFGGDSAGAQIAGQYVALQTNDTYAKEMGVEQIIPKDSIHAFISFSGPLDLQQMTTVQSSDPFMKFFTSTVARAFIGTKDWKESDEIKQASVKEYITTDFPPTYITDGNTFSFQDQGIAFAAELKYFGIPVQTLFFKDLDKEISHEYQFNYQLTEAKESLKQTIHFIDQQLR
ncbi:alpha/beta hydrolase [Ornithinibacillus gellani]|uniref:alpha/beta hydrolase n=1 Tax=Ornithinibacillus gellani TaxID=2293253 RepID=UPI000F473C39|nr:alpha/beta hydrolase [Ornithinibacillus gellani]TQS75600.1 alpha/beta hydrolase [Ornithinibacillus gellani]